MTTRRLVAIAVFCALITVGGLISVPVPFTQVQLSFQTLFVIIAGLVLGGTDGALAVLIYVVMGLAGLPVFTQGGGIGYVFMPSFGYLLGFPVGAFVSGSISSKLKKPTRGKVFIAAVVGMVPVYLIGGTYQMLILHYYMGSTWAAALAGIPGLVGLFVKDAVLCGLTTVIYPAIRRALRYRTAKNSHGAELTRNKLGN